ncbi:MAG: glycosyltransferase family 39 protein [Planctomycetota bacterium]
MNPPSSITGQHRTWMLALMVTCAAAAVRWPGCDESFWLDELHSAWTVWGSFGNVSQRAAIGNQTPIWFWTLWGFKGIAGDSESGLRLISVLTTSTACGLITLLLARKYSLAAALAAGGVLAFESNAIFFGTELRPYGTVVLLATLAVVGSARVMWIATAVAVSMQPTAVIVLLPWCIGRSWLIRNQSFRPGNQAQQVQGVDNPSAKVPWVIAIVAVLAILIIVMTYVWPSLIARDRWASFATAGGWNSIASLWPWTWLLILPSCVLIFAHKDSSPNINKASVYLSILLIILSVGGLWFLSNMDWIHLWHRRYLISLLPVFACLVSMAVESSSPPVRWPVAVLWLLGLTSAQGNLESLVTAPSAITRRGEDWRSAIEFVSTETYYPIAMEAGLIESDAMMSKGGLTELESAYLTCVARGPYELPVERVYPHRQPGDTRKFVWITRNRIGEQLKSRASQIHQFGSVKVVLGERSTVRLKNDDKLKVSHPPD